MKTETKDKPWLFRHGGSRRGRHTPEYRVWAGMRQRCCNTRNCRYDRYGGRGISICERWSDFALFLEDMGPRPSPGHSLDRINNDGNYEKGNCRWATRSQQQQNKSTYRTDHKLPRGDDHWTRQDRVRAASVARKNIVATHKNGSENGNAKLNNQTASALRKAYEADPGVTLTELGRRFGVGRETARKVVRGIAWS